MTDGTHASRPWWRRLLLRWWPIGLLIATLGWVAWRQYDFRAAVREAKAAGLDFKMSDNPFAVIRKDWRAAFRKATWTDHQRELAIPYGTDLAPLKSLIYRLRPTKLAAERCENVDALRKLTSLEELHLSPCFSLKDVDVLKGLTRLQRLDLGGCTFQNVDALKWLTRLQWLNLSYSTLFHVFTERGWSPGAHRAGSSGSQRLPTAKRGRPERTPRAAKTLLGRLCQNFRLRPA